MLSTRSPNAKARRSREKDMMSHFENMDVLFESQNANPTEREIANTINYSVSHNDLGSDSRIRTNPSVENEIKDFNHGDQLTFSNEINMRFPKEMDAMINESVIQRYKISKV